MIFILYALSIGLSFMLLCGSTVVTYKRRLCITSPSIYGLVGLHTRVKIRRGMVEMIETMFQTFRFAIGGF
jgi:hypothetical protein